MKDKRIVELDRIVTEVKESEEWEAAQMNILEVGISKGISQGEQKNLVTLICKKLLKGYDIADIAEHVEEDIEKVQKICDVAEKYAPDYDVEKIMRELR